MASPPESTVSSAPADVLAGAETRLPDAADGAGASGGTESEDASGSPCLISADRLAERLQALPRKPGVYLMRDAHARVIYVGKAGVLRNRVRSYFGSQDDLTSKTQAMVARIADFEYIVTGSEKEALL